MERRNGLHAAPLRRMGRGPHPWSLGATLHMLGVRVSGGGVMAPISPFIAFLQPIFIPMQFFPHIVGMPCTHVGNYSNPSFGPFSQASVEAVRFALQSTLPDR